MFAKQNWEQWRSAGMDQHSQFADPGFNDPQHGDFTIKGDAAHVVPGFAPFDVKTVCPRPHKG